MGEWARKYRLAMRYVTLSVGIIAEQKIEITTLSSSALKLSSKQEKQKRPKSFACPIGKHSLFAPMTFATATAPCFAMPELISSSQ